MFPHHRDTYRRTFIDAWRKHQTGRPLAPLESQIVGVVERHPEFQPLLSDDPSSLQRDFSPDEGDANPFLHLGLHLAILDQLSIDQPRGIRRLHARLVERLGDPHQAEHQMMACLAEGLWRLQQSQAPFSEQDYLACVERR